MFKKLALALALFAASAGVVLGAHAPGKRDDNLPARVPYVFPAPGTNPVADTIRERREGGILLDLDGVLLNDNALAGAWNTLFGVIRDNNTVPADMRELFILRTGTLNNAAYVWLQHESSGRAAGLTTAQLRAIRETPAFGTPHGLSPELTAALRFADAVTRQVNVPRATYDGLKRFLDDRQMVDATATVGGYNFVSRFVEALDIDSKANVPVPIPH